MSALINALEYSEPGPEVGRRLVEAALFGKSGITDGQAWWPRLKKSELAKQELAELVRILKHKNTILPTEDPDLADTNLLLHAQYMLAEIMAAFDVRSDDGRAWQSPQAGVLSVAGGKYDIFLVTLQKSEKEYSPSTMYEDYAISPTEFHWQSQNNARPGKGMGERHVRHRDLGITPLLFVRTTRKDERGATMPYRFLGPVSIVDYNGERPISITWRLKHPMPSKLFQAATLLSS
jgi:hypothetical protein